MFARTLFALSLWLALGASSVAGNPAAEISLGVREDAGPGLPQVDCPLAFRAKNVGTEPVKAEQVTQLFFQGVIHILPTAGEEAQTSFQRSWRTGIHDLAPGATFEAPVYGNLRAFFPTLTDGDYQVWWSLGEQRSNILQFTVTGGAVALRNPKT